MNSEIFGFPTNLPWGVEFVRATRFYPLVARHPTQIYEALAYLCIFLVLMFVYYKTEYKNKQGFMLGIFFIFAFAARFTIEFLKENQEAFEDSMTLNMGQMLSIPFILAGFYFIFRKEKTIEVKTTNNDNALSNNIKTGKQPE